MTSYCLKLLIMLQATQLSGWIEQSTSMNCSKSHQLATPGFYLNSQFMQLLQLTQISHCGKRLKIGEYDFTSQLTFGMCSQRHRQSAIKINKVPVNCYKYLTLQDYRCKSPATEHCNVGSTRWIWQLTLMLHSTMKCGTQVQHFGKRMQLTWQITAYHYSYTQLRI